MVSDILPDIVYDIPQAGFLPPLDKEAAGIITDSEAIFKEFARKHSLNASTINSFIKAVLKNPPFNADEVDCSDRKPPSTAVTFRSLTCMLRGMESKIWSRLGAQWRSSCSSLWQICAWPGVSTLDFKSTTCTRTRVATDFLQGNQMV
jgi:hypothetical protein